MNFLFKYFAKQIVVNVHPSKFIFTCSKDNINFSIETFVYIDNGKSKSEFIAIGNELPSNQLTKPDIYRINIFDLNEPLPPRTTFSRADLIQVIFQYSIGKIYENDFLPTLRPVVFILGADGFTNYLANPRDELRVAAKNGGAKVVIFDKTDL
ncbi:hypothetical protein [Candidatus Villigracilis saccharophilus]|uniref:hypothetical protein n=1 Tax=Candidatus Villigracilis saccharophilus TaxID=3140684 RepID=UPI003136B647|nr:hypothetical protein [Anaerolineales bacterium]